MGVEPGTGEADVEDEDMTLRNRELLCTTVGRSDLDSPARSRVGDGIL